MCAWNVLKQLFSHYVAFVRKQIPDEGSESWTLYNDEKVVKALDVEDMKRFAYVYFFKRLEVSKKQ